jgi:DNA-binding transcriptional MerR regulator
MNKQFIKRIVYPVFKSRPDFLIIGAQKAGTTSLYRYLSQHPQIRENNTWKEIHYFDKPENYHQGFGWYLGHFPAKLSKGNKLTCDATPSYLYYKHVPQLIKQDLGSIKMIAVLRNPTDRAYSAWQMHKNFSMASYEGLKKIADERSFSEAIDQELSSDFNSTEDLYNYIDRGKYVNQLKNYYRYFREKDILVLNINSFSTDLEYVLNRVCDFLNIENFSSEKIQNLSKQKHNAGNYKNNKTKADQEKLDFLKEYFAPFNESLYQLLGKRYNW